MRVSPDFKRFFQSFTLIIFVLFFADWLVGSGLKHLYKKQTSGLLYRTNYSLDSTTADFLVFGSSRASHHYDPDVFEKRLKSTFYNCGRDGQGSIYSCAIASAVVDRYKPKCIIIDIRPDEFTSSDEGKLSSLFPYNDNKTIRAYYRYEGPLEKFKFISHIYPYNSLLTNLLVGITSFNKKRSQDYHGFLPLKGTKEKKYIEFKESTTVDTAKVRYFKELLTKLDKVKLPTFVVISPVYGNVIDGKTASISAEMCSHFKKTKFLNLTHRPLGKESQYFNDSYHLNADGAKIFSNELITEMEPTIK